MYACTLILFLAINAHAYSGLLLILFKAYHEAIICFETGLKKQHSSHVASYLRTYIEYFSQFIMFVLSRGYELLTVVKYGAWNLVS